MEHISIQNTVTQHFSQISLLQEDSKNKTKELYAQIKEIEQSFNNQIKVINNQLQVIQEQYQDIVLDLAMEQHKCPVSRSGSPLTPDEINIEDDGIYMTWYGDAPGKYYSDYFFASWEEIIKAHNQSTN